MALQTFTIVYKHFHLRDFFNSSCSFRPPFLRIKTCPERHVGRRKGAIKKNISLHINISNLNPNKSIRREYSQSRSSTQHWLYLYFNQPLITISISTEPKLRYGPPPRGTKNRDSETLAKSPFTK